MINYSGSMVYYQGSLYLFGGSTISLTSDDSLYKYDIAEMQWSLIDTVNNPTPRYHLGTILIGSKFFVFPGWNDDLLADVPTFHEIDLSAPRYWKSLPVHDSKGIMTRDSYGYVSVGSSAYIFAGWSESEGILNDILQINLGKFNLASTNISAVQLSATFDYPSRRKHPVMENLGTSMLLFGGKGENSM